MFWLFCPIPTQKFQPTHIDQCTQNNIWTKPHIFWCVSWLITLVLICADYVSIILTHSDTTIPSDPYWPTEITHGHQTPHFLMCFFINYTYFDMSWLCFNYSDPFRPKKFNQSQVDQFTDITWVTTSHILMCFLTNYTYFDILRLWFNYFDPFWLKKLHPTHIDQCTDIT